MNLKLQGEKDYPNLTLHVHLHFELLGFGPDDKNGIHQRCTGKAVRHNVNIIEA